MAMTPPPAAQRLSKTPPPKSPRATANTRIAVDGKIDVGQIPGRPVGEPEHAPGYDPRDARTGSKGQIDQLLSEGAALLQDGRFERARKAFQEAVQRDPQRPEGYNGVGVTFYARGDLDEALAWYKRSLEADPRFGDAFYNMACIYALQQHKDLAFRYLRMAALNHYSERDAMEKDPDLASLRAEPQWRELLDQMRP
jgi:tetratricopeptide (TPR) repeat protein